MKSIKELLANRKYEQNIGKQDFVGLLSNLQKVEQMRAELKVKNPSVQLQMLKCINGSYKIILENLTA